MPRYEGYWANLPSYFTQVKMNLPFPPSAEQKDKSVVRLTPHSAVILMTS